MPLIISTKNSKKWKFFQVQKFKYLWNHLFKFKKQAHSKILLLRAFKWAINELLLKKLKFQCGQPKNDKLKIKITKEQWLLY